MHCSDKNSLSRPKDFEVGDDTISSGSVVAFTVKYVGCIEVYASMKVLDFPTRSLVARECIRRVCDTISSKTPQKRHVDKKIKRCISEHACMEHAASNVSLNISSRNLEIVSLDTNDVIARHEMPRISFASGGDMVSNCFVSLNFSSIFHFTKGFSWLHNVYCKRHNWLESCLCHWMWKRQSPVNYINNGPSLWTSF